MTNVMESYEEQHVRAVIAYGHSDNKLYEDAAHTTQMEQAAALELFQKGLLLVKFGTAFFKPVKMDDNKVYTMNVASSTVSMPAWDTKATA